MVFLLSQECLALGGCCCGCQAWQADAALTLLLLLQAWHADAELTLLLLQAWQGAAEMSLLLLQAALLTLLPGEQRGR